jgi:hypothetical protein
LYLDTGTIIGITIALATSCLVMVISIREQGKLIRKVRDLQVALRDERRK